MKGDINGGRMEEFAVVVCGDVGRKELEILCLAAKWDDPRYVT